MIEDGVSFAEIKGDLSSFTNMSYNNSCSSVKEKIYGEVEDFSIYDDEITIRVIWVIIKSQGLNDLEEALRALIWRINYFNKKIKIIIQTDIIPQSLSEWTQPLTFTALNDDSSSVSFVKELLQTTLKQLKAPEHSLSNQFVTNIYRHLRGVDIPNCSRSIHAALAIVMRNPNSKSWQEALLKQLSRTKTSVLNTISGLELVPVDEFDTSTLSAMNRYLRYLEYVKTVYENEEEADKQRIERPKGVLFVGLPGCGKSMAAKATAKTLDVPLIRLDLSQLMGRYLGESEERLDKALRAVASISPCVLFIDEIEKSIGSLSGNQGEGGTGLRMLSQLLTWMQEQNKDIFLFATANKITTLPPELLRRGRFDELWCVRLPSDQERVTLIKGALRLKNLNLPALEIEELASLTNDFSGADLVALIKNTHIYLFTQNRNALKLSDFKEILRDFIPMTRQFKAQITEMSAQLDQYGFIDVSSDVSLPEVKRQPPVDQELITYFLSQERWLIKFRSENQSNKHHLLIQSLNQHSCLLTDQMDLERLDVSMPQVQECSLSYTQRQGFIKITPKDIGKIKHLGVNQWIELRDNEGLFSLTLDSGQHFFESSRMRSSLLRGDLTDKKQKKW